MARIRPNMTLSRLVIMDEWAMTLFAGGKMVTAGRCNGQFKISASQSLRTVMMAKWSMRAWSCERASRVANPRRGQC